MGNVVGRETSTKVSHYLVVVGVGGAVAAGVVGWRRKFVGRSYHQ